jgi:hypothetical protein
MRTNTIVGFLGLVAVLLGCSEGSALPAEASMDRGTTAVPVSTRHFAAPLRGAAEVPPNASDAIGMAGFNVRANASAIDYMVLIGRLDNTTQGHIHLAAAGTNGPVVAWLYPSGPPAQPIPGEFNGVLGEGTLTAASLVGPLAGQPLSALIDAMRAGNTYVNIHTQAIPAGEIRGQIVALPLLD